MGGTWWWWLQIQLFQSTHLQFFLLLSATLQQSNRKMSKVTNYAILVCFSVYLFMGVFGYFHYGNDTKGNVLQNCFPTEDPMVVLSFGTCRCITCRCCWLDVLCHVYLCSQEPNDSLVSMLFYFSIFLKRPLLWPLSWLFPWSSFLVVIRWTWCWNICLKATAVATTVVVRLVKSYLEATTPKNWILASLGTTPTTSTKQMSMCTQLLRNVVTWHWRHSSAPRRWPLHCLCQKFKSCFNWWVVREFVETGVCKRPWLTGCFIFCPSNTNPFSPQVQPVLLCVSYCQRRLCWNYNKQNDCN